MVQNLKTLEERIAKGEELLKQLNEQARQLSEVLIPDTLMSLGLSELKLSTGEKVNVSKFYAAKIPDQYLPLAFKWLRENKHDDLIKNNLTLSFGKGDDDKANTLALELVKRGFAPEQKIFVHPMTLKSFVKEQIEGGSKDLPYDLFGVFVGNKTKITPAKK